MTNKKTIINLTPHSLTIFKNNCFERIVIPSSGIVRVVEEGAEIGGINGIPLYWKKYTKSEGLPEPKKDTYYFVSLIVAQANPHRKDLLLSNELVRDENGRILGCRSFSKL